MIRVLIVDDSALIRIMLSEILRADDNIEVIGVASNPNDAARIIAKEIPDVITLDIEMPHMNGLTFLKRIMAQKPIPTVIISSLTEERGEVALEALALGAIEVIVKPRMDSEESKKESRIKILDAVKAASLSRIKRKREVEIIVQPKFSADIVLKKAVGKKMYDTEKVVVIGASTGGTKAIYDILKMMPPNAPGIAIVQHMPEIFTRSFADRLNAEVAMNVKEAEDGDVLSAGKVLIAPGNKHLIIKRIGNDYFVKLIDAASVNRHRPSVDVLFRSAAVAAGRNAVGVILTGMGDDGAKGLLKLKEAGGRTIGQDENSCIVYGMPYVANNIGAVEFQLPLNKIANKVLKL